MSSDDREKGPRTDSAGRLPAPPPALYPCSREDCRQDRTWPPNDIVWFDGQDETLDKAGDIDRSKVAAGWYCVECVAELEIEPAGPRLDEALRAEGREDLPGEKRADPACTECAFYGGDADCCHPTSLIVHGNGVYDSASGMRRSWCGHGGMLFTPWPRRQKRQRVRARVLAVGRVTQIGAMQRVQIALDGERGRRNRASRRSDDSTEVGAGAESGVHHDTLAQTRRRTGAGGVGKGRHGQRAVSAVEAATHMLGNRPARRPARIAACAGIHQEQRWTGTR